MIEFGFLRESTEAAKKAGKDLDTGLCRTGLDEYLKIIFPDVNDWIHDRCIPNSGIKCRPDYRSEQLKLIIEFDGLPHYQSPAQIKKDETTKHLYERLGYKVVRIPYFIQLSNPVVKKLFDVKCEEPLFDETIPSLGALNPANPAFLCPAGIIRMAKEFYLVSPEQYVVNIQALEKVNDDFITGVSYLKSAYNKIASSR